MKSIVITGSTRGIGLAMAKEFLRAGCRVTLSGRGETLAQGTRETLRAFEGSYQYVPCNVQQISQLQALWNAATDRFGAVDIWINNAGQNVPHERIADTEERYVREVVETNLLGMVFGAQVAARGMLKQGYGAIYSMEGLGSNDMIQIKTVLYGTSKRALTYFMKGLAKELAGSGVIAGRLSPGMMLTDFITKTPDGAPAAIETDGSFQKIFNILADRPETVAAFFVPRILRNTKNDRQIAWLTGCKSARRFLCAPFRKRKLI
ncbi:3-phenylpropionate-dihydrodiol/cinnamic acid-dihydrodiol dehydrogenase [bioreactor metagenome]|uniref:3-phenylpropionate-dihydrodiol/cinnamic acid-dihydrodiol dehydrogenase n=1 Tax=bioreactor metagenome TaxID=1076179 RepID=A0A644ZZ82_9ZZZZ|nr:SDR family oxidoreductase [Christensenella sp.]